MSSCGRIASTAALPSLTSANALSVAGGQLYVVGRIQQTAGDDDLLIRRYDPNTGALIWHQLFAGPAGERDDGIAVAIGRNRVFVGGFAAHIPGVSGLGRASLSCIHRRTGVGPIIVTASKLPPLRPEATASLPAGQQGDRAVVRAYDAATGSLLWDDVLGTEHFHRGGGRHRPSLRVLGGVRRRRRRGVTLHLSYA